MKSFYVPDDSLPVGEPGSLIRHEPLNACFSPRVPMRGRAWRILYRSTKADGTPSAVSGAVLVPRRVHARTPIVGYAPGTHGLADGAAPSRLLERGLEFEAPFIAMILARGWAVAVTDYEGLGTPGDHPYCVGRALGRNVLDVMRAARALEPAGLPAGGPLGVSGYSEGGLAAGWAAQLHGEYAPELDIGAIAAGSVPAELDDLGHHVEGGIFSFFAGYGAIGFNAGYPELGLERYLNERGRRELHALRRTSVVTAALRLRRYRAEDIMSTNVLLLPDWLARIRENNLGAIAPIAPTLVYTARRDPLVPPGLTRELYARWRDLGAEVELKVNRGVDHITGMTAGMPPALRWLAARLGDNRSRSPVPGPGQPSPAAA